MPMPGDAATWLAQVQHDLVKRLLWPARDRRDLGGAVVPGELRVALTADDGATISARQLWIALSAQAPRTVTPAALSAFGSAVARAADAAAADDLAGVLALEAAFAALAQIVKASAGGPPGT